MRLLSFDTSNPVLTVALMEDGEMVSARRVVPPESSRQEAVSQLMPSIDSITSSCNWSRDSIDLIVVGVGPGSFTGMRTSVVTARTLAQALDVALVGVDALKCYASALPLPSTIVLSGGRGHYFVASYLCDEETKAEWQFGDPQLLCSLTPCRLLGDGLKDAVCDAKNCFVEEKIYDEVYALNSAAKTIPEHLNLASIQASLIWSDLNLSNKDREGLKNLYTFREVNPLYLRGASITLKPTANAADTPSNRH